MSTGSYSESQSSWSEDSYEDVNEEIEKLDANKLHRHDIISYKSSVGEEDRLTEDRSDSDMKSDITNPELKRKLSRNLSEHLHWKKKSNKARYLRNELENEMESEEWISALSTCKKILDLQAFNFEPVYHFYCGFIYETGFNNYESAERHYRVALQLEQTNDKHIRYYARILRRLERYEQAEHVYQYGLEQHSNNQFIRYEYSYLLWLSQKYKHSLQQLKYCIDTNELQSGENVYWLYGRIQSEIGNQMEAKKYLSYCIQLKANDIGYRVDYMLYLINNKKYKDALKYYNNIMAVHKPAGAIINEYTFSYIYLQSVYGYLLSYGFKKYKKASEIFEDLLKHNKNNYFEIHFYYGLHLYHRNRNEHRTENNEAILHQFISALIIEDNWAISYYYISLALYDIGEYYSALHFLNKAFKMNALLPTIYKTYYSLKEKIDAQISHNDEDSDDEEHIHHLAVMQYKKRNWSLACILFLRLLTINEDNTNYQHNLAMVLYYGFENMECSEKYFRKSLKSCGSSHPDIIRHYNVLLIKQQRYEEANAYYQILFKICNKYKYKLTIDDHISFANVTFNLKQFSQCKEHLKIALKIKPNDGYIIGKYAILLQQINSFSLSFEYFKHSLSFIPNDIEIRYEFSNLLWRMQDHTSACNELKLCLDHIATDKNKHAKDKKQQKLLLMEEKCCILYGIIAIQLEQYHIAKRLIDKAIELTVFDIRYIAELMLLLIKMKQFNEAYNYYINACKYIEKHSQYNKVNTWYLDLIYAIYLSEIGKYEEANVLFTKLIESNESKVSPSYHIHFYYAQYLHYKLQNYFAAKEQYIKAITIEDYWAITYWHLSKALLQLKEYKSAQTFCKRAFAMNKQIPCITDHYKRQMKLIQREREREMGMGNDRDNTDTATATATATNDHYLSYQYKKRYHRQHNGSHVKNALGIAKKNRAKTKTKNKTKKNKNNLNMQRPRRKSNLYASNSNLLEEASLDNMHKKIEKNKRNKKKRKRKAKKKKNKLTKDSNKMYNSKYNKMYGITKQRKTRERKKKSKSKPKNSANDMSDVNISHRKSQSDTTHSITMISASEEYHTHDHIMNDGRSSTKSY